MSDLSSMPDLTNLPMLGWTGTDAPPEWKGLAPADLGEPISVVLFHPPLAGVIDALPIELFETLIGPGLVLAVKATEGEDIGVKFAKVMAPSGELVLFTYRVD